MCCVDELARPRGRRDDHGASTCAGKRISISCAPRISGSRDSGASERCPGIHLLVNTPLRIALVMAAMPIASAGSADDAVVPLEDIVVTVMRHEDAALEVPASIDAIAIEPGHYNRAGTHLSEVLGLTPGVSVRNRQNHAQDEQLSIRGFGARATFGVRGVRLYADGIPASMPDGSGQVSHFSLDGAQRIEILRGPFSALYGNSSGGVIQIFSATGTDEDQWRVTGRSGSDGFRRFGVSGLGRIGDTAYNVSLARFETDGFRDHSAARRDAANLKLDRDFGSRRLSLIANAIDMPDVQDPLGLTWQQVQDDPRQATAAARQFNTRKSVSQAQAGLAFEQDIGHAHTLRLLGYSGNRAVEQFLAIPIAPQAHALHSGGVVDLGTSYNGLDARWSYSTEFADRSFNLVAGLNIDSQNQTRRGYENFIGTTPGVRGALRRNERNSVKDFDQYLQADWRIGEHWSLLAGVRRSAVKFASRDRYIVGDNPDDSGRVKYSATTPVAGLMIHASDRLKLYASHGEGFETPTFAELSYRADGAAGLAFDLVPATSRNREVGLKWQPTGRLSLEAALFRADTNDELAVARNTGGRSSFRNIGTARRQGAEFSLAMQLAQPLSLRLAWTRVEAQFRADFLACTGTPCLAPDTLVEAGAPIPGVPRSQLAARLEWKQGAWQAAFDASRTGVVVANDIGSAFAPACTLAGLEAARGFGRLRLSARLDNMFDKACIGSVIVNEGNGRYYEPGPGRQWLAGAQWMF